MSRLDQVLARPWNAMRSGLSAIGQVLKKAGIWLVLALRIPIPISHQASFSGWGFAVGSVRGVRDFRVDDRGRLTGVAYQLPWTPGENIAVCAGGSHTRLKMLLQALGKGIKISPDPAYGVADLRSDCTCGFYAYFNPNWRSFIAFEGARTIPAVIDAYGKVQMGSRGFRAGKARIRAITFNQAWERNYFDRYPHHSLWLGWCMLNLPLNLAPAFEGKAPSPFIVVWITLIASHVVSMLDIRRARQVAKTGCPKGSDHSKAPTEKPLIPFLPKLRLVRRVSDCGCSFRQYRAGCRISPTLAANIRGRYPDVEVFDSMKEMLKAFPLDKPQGPLPEALQDGAA